MFGYYMKKRNCISLVMGLIFSSVSSQDGFVVTTKGDTLFGKITFQQIGKIEQVLVKGDKRQNISSIQVLTAQANDKIYRPIQFLGMVQMMEVIKDGYLSLLAFQPPGIMNYDGRLLKLRSGDVLEVPTIGFKKRVSEFLKDNVNLASQIKDGDLDRKDLDKIIDEYNLFIGKNTVTSSQQRKEEAAQLPKLESIDVLIEAIKNSNLESKTETLEMLAELKDKITDNKSVPQYLSNALKENLKSSSEWVEKLESILKD